MLRRISGSHDCRHPGIGPAKANPLTQFSAPYTLFSPPSHHLTHATSSRNRTGFRAARMLPENRIRHHRKDVSGAQELAYGVNSRHPVRTEPTRITNKIARSLSPFEPRHSHHSSRVPDHPFGLRCPQGGSLSMSIPPVRATPCTQTPQKTRARLGSHGI